MPEWMWFVIVAALVALPFFVMAGLSRINKHRSSDGVVIAIQRTLAELKASVTKFVSSGLSLLFGLCILGLLIWIPCRFIWGVVPDATKLPLRYASSDGIPESSVHVDSRPTDCDFLHAPLGTKDCSYKQEVYRVKDTNGRTSEIYVTWTKQKD